MAQSRQDGLTDTCQRRIDYLRVSITDRCNLRCGYCMPTTGVSFRPREEMLTYEELAAVIKAAVELGVSRVRITGGEPLVRKGIVDFVAILVSAGGISDLSLTTNATLLGDMAGDLARAGLHRVNISLDSLRADRFRDITRGGDLDTVWRGIRAALDAGLEPVKLNVVLINGVNDDEIQDFARLTVDWPLHVRFIELMPMGELGYDMASLRVDSARVRQQLVDRWGDLVPATIRGAGPAVCVSLPGAKGTVGLISPMTEHFCGTCNRLRLSADGSIYSCLVSSTGLSTLSALRPDLDPEALKGLVRRAVELKPDRHSLGDGLAGRRQKMSRLGG